MLRKLFYPQHLEHSLRIVREFQKTYPSLIIGGSIALYLHGVRLKRFRRWKGDLDFLNKGPIQIDMDVSKELPSNCDFQEQGMFKTKKIDLRVDPLTTFEEITFRGFTYKVNILEDILEAKCRYKRDKDKQDIREMLKIN